MAKKIAIGLQNFGDIIRENYFYIDKTSFIKEWWEAGDSVTLITRPRRFGKTLNMSMLEHFFSVNYANEKELFEYLDIWKEEKYQMLQGTYPVINLSFANIKEKDYKTTRQKICQLISDLYDKYDNIFKDILSDRDMEFVKGVSVNMDDFNASLALNKLSYFLNKYYSKNVIILLDEYDTPMQEAYIHGYWNELVYFTRSLFNATFKTNPWLERGLMTGITRVSKESIFSDLNHLEIVTTTSNKYATSFGFTEQEVFEALEQYNLSEVKSEVKRWYDGFIFGTQADIYNPWSILNFIEKKQFTTYWANTSSNSLVGNLLKEGNHKIKKQFELLLNGNSIRVPIDEQIVYNQLDTNDCAIWSLLLASGYLKVLSYDRAELLMPYEEVHYVLTLTNYEVNRMFYTMVRDWFRSSQDYNDFVQALLCDDLDAMNEYMNRVALQTFSYFDTGKQAHGAEPERFYHGFVLGLMVELQNRYIITSNQESGFGRYDVVLEPRVPNENDAIILEFKVKNKRKEKTLEETVAIALKQIEEKQYATQLINHGISKDRIRSYGFAFEGKTVLIG